MQVKQMFVKIMLAVVVIGSLSAVSSAFALLEVYVTGSPSLPRGTKVRVSIGGEGCNCSAPSVAGEAGNGGAAIVRFNLGDCHPNDRCVVYVAGSVESGGKTTLYKGQSSLIMPRTNVIIRPATP